MAMLRTVPDSKDGGKGEWDDYVKCPLYIRARDLVSLGVPGIQHRASFLVGPLDACRVEVGEAGLG